MTQELLHRGPDAQKLWAAPGVGLAHARLSIIDLQASADQPMVDPDTGNQLVFNGEIYNYLELRQELLTRGHVFQTQSDTEVVLKAYAEWGVDCLQHFNGMWAVALFDAHSKTLFCARDRFGIKPFVYGLTHDRDMVFASEAKAIVRHFPEFKQANASFLFSFVERDFFACYKETFYKNIFNLLPGHYFVAQSGKTPVQKRYWKWTPSSICPDLKHLRDSDIVEHFNDLLTDSIRLRFRSDVPVGVCLSGGMDSGTIAGVASRIFQGHLNSFSCIFPSAPTFDESEYIYASVNKFRTSPHYIEPRHDDLIQTIQALNDEQDGPTGGPSVLSQRAVMSLAGQHVKVILDGQGADEVLGGYHGYFQTSLLTYARKIKAEKTLRHLYNYSSHAAKLKRRSGKQQAKLNDLLPIAEKLPQFNTARFEETQLGYFQPFKEDDLNTLLLEHVFTNLTNLLHYEDRNSMRFSVESRLPFLDYRLVEYAFSLPHHYKIRGDKTKWLLHGVARHVLPKKVLKRKDKMGFTTPGHEWLSKQQNYVYFKQYFSNDNYIYRHLTPFMQEHLTQSFHRLSDPSSGTHPNSIDINGLWRFITANMWLQA